MMREEMIDVLITQFTMLQRIKKDEGDHINPALEYEIKSLTARLSTLGVNVEDLTL